MTCMPGEGWTIAGWVRSSTAPATRFAIAVLCHGQEVARATADNFRQDLVIPGEADGHHAFSVIVPDTKGVGDADLTAFDVITLPDRQRLPLTEQLAAAAHVTIRASIDIIGRDRIAGWLRNEAAPTTRLSVAVMVDGALRHRTLANQFRSDLRDSGLGDGRYGFDILLNPPLSAESDHTVVILCPETGANLPGSPIHFPATRRFNEIFRQHVRQTLGGIASARQRDQALAFLAEQADQLRFQQGREDSRQTATLQHRAAQRLGRTDADAATPPRLLFVDDRAPDPSRDAGSNALLSHMVAACDLHYEVSFIASVMPPSSAAIRQLEDQGITCWHPPAYPTVETLLRSQSNSFDGIYFHRLSNATRYLDLARLYMPGARLISSAADLAWLRLQRESIAENRPELRMAAGQEKVREHMAAWASHAVITHSSVEANLLGAAVPTASIYVVPWHLRLKEPPLSFDLRHGVAFIAHYGHAPNLDAAKWLVGEIWPRVRAHSPGIELLLVGSAMPDAVVRMDEIDGVRVLGHVADLDGFLRSVRLTIAPLRFGAGIKGKVLESWASGIPCVATPIAVEGMSLPPALLPAVASSAEDIARLTCELYENKDLSESLADAGREYIRIRHSEERVRNALERSLGLPRVSTTSK
ncbi:glycosyltransferase [Acetobacter conturbans]|nr:glycosyltransferase [Acetobacter conturbans]